MRSRWRTRIVINAVICIAFVVAICAVYFLLPQNKSLWSTMMLALLAAMGVDIIISSLLLNRAINKQITSDAVRVSVHQHRYLDQWINPYVIVDEAYNIHWQNKAYTSLRETLKGDPLEVLKPQISELPKMTETPIKLQVRLEGHDYELNIVMLQPSEDDEQSRDMFALSLEDISEKIRLKRENEGMHPVSCLLYVDNYDTIMNLVEEQHKPILEAQIYRKLSDMASQTEGILTRLEKDRFFIVCPKKGLDQVIAKRFPILEEFKKIKTDTNLPFTMSVGVGVSNKLDRAQEYARSAVDLALGRGGDQAIVKNDEKYQFYGGNSAGTEKNIRTHARLIAYALREMINTSDRVVIMGHKNPDLDCFGAALGMYRIVTALKKPAYIFMNPEHPAIDLLYDRVRYEREYRNVIVNAEQAHSLSGDNTLVIVVDVNRPSICGCPELLEWNRNVAVIDHHRAGVEHVQNAQVTYVEPFASSACELVTELLQYISEKIRLKPIEADGLFAGMALDTKNFASKTGARTFEAAAYLRRNGADAIRVQKLFRTEMSEYKAKAHIVSQARIFRDQMAAAGWRGVGIENAVTIAAKAADELLNIEGVKASFVLTEMEDQIWISARSMGEINVQVIMEKIGGGGHQNMAGTQLKCSMEEARSQLEEAVAQYMQER